MSTNPNPRLSDADLSAYLDDELAAEQRVALEAALAESPELRGRLHELLQVVQAVRALPVARADADLSGHLVERFTRDHSRRVVAIGRIWRLARYGSAAAALALCTTVGWMAGRWTGTQAAGAVGMTARPQSPGVGVEERKASETAVARREFPAVVLAAPATDAERLADEVNPGEQPKVAGNKRQAQADVSHTDRIADGSDEARPARRADLATRTLSPAVQPDAAVEVTVAPADGQQFAAILRETNSLHYVVSPDKRRTAPHDAEHRNAGSDLTEQQTTEADSGPLVIDLEIDANELPTALAQLGSIVNERMSLTVTGKAMTQAVNSLAEEGDRDLASSATLSMKTEHTEPVEPSVHAGRSQYSAPQSPKRTDAEASVRPNAAAPRQRDVAKERAAAVAAPSRSEQTFSPLLEGDPAAREEQEFLETVRQAQGAPPPASQRQSMDDSASSASEAPVAFDAQVRAPASRPVRIRLNVLRPGRHGEAAAIPERR